MYSLGVVLYELLAGVSPYRAAAGNSRALHHAVLEQVPPRPSESVHQPAPESLAREDNGEAVAAAGAESRAQARSTDTRSLARRLRGDLDTLILKALRKSPEHRYASVGELADDLSRHLANRPIRARPASAGYRARRFVRRHRVATALTALLVLLAVVFVAAEVRQGRRLAREKEAANAAADLAEQERGRAQHVSDFLFGLLSDANPFETGHADVTVREVVDRAKDHLDDLDDEPALQEDSMLTLGLLYERLGDYETAETLLRRALEERRARLGDEHPDMAKAYRSLGVVLSQKQEREEAEQLLRSALAIERRSGEGDSLAVARTLGELSLLAQNAGRFEESRDLVTEAIAMYRRFAGPLHPELATAIHNSGGVLYRLGEYQEGLQQLEEALRMREELFGADSLQVAATLGDMSAVEDDLGRLARAIDLRRRALEIESRELPEGHPHLTTSRIQLAGLASTDGRHEEAVALYCRALADRREFFGAEHERVGDVMNNLGTALRAGGRLSAADRAADRALTIWRSHLGDEHWKVSIGYYNKAWLEALLGREEEALAHARQALRFGGASLGEQHPRVIDFRLGVGRALLYIGRSEEALPYLEQAAAEYAETEPKKEADRLFSEVLAGAAMVGAGRLDEGQGRMESAYEGLRSELSADHYRVREATSVLAAAFDRRGLPEKAAPYRERLRRFPPPVLADEVVPGRDDDPEALCRLVLERRGDPGSAEESGA